MELIYNQNDIPKDKWRYGLRSSAKVGCGWVATYNALALMDREVDVNNLIRSYERQLPLINGNVGTLFCGPALLLRHWGFPVKVTASVKNYDEACRNADVGILFYYWRKGWKIGSHFVAVHAAEHGFVGYNTYRNSTGPDHYGPSLSEFIRKQGYYATVLITVRNKD